MAGHSLTTTASLQCPHGGVVQVLSTNTRARADRAPLTTNSDTFVITGCPYLIPGTSIPSPCVRVQWLIPDTRVKVNGSQALSRSSTGLCLSAAGAPQGPVIVINTQTRVQSQ
jgi:hypothetical protein